MGGSARSIRSAAGVVALAVAGCGPFTQQPGTVPVNFRVDDRLNASFHEGELSWKGEYTFNEGRRVITFDNTWAGGVGPYPLLYDDGPWTQGGHEPPDASAGDHIWGVTVFVVRPDAGADAGVAYGYGLFDEALNRLEPGSGWIWPGDNGSFEVAPGASEPIEAPGLVLPAFGTTDLKLVLNVNLLSTFKRWNTGTLGDTDKVKVKGSWAWYLLPTFDDGTHEDERAKDGKYTFTLSYVLGKPPFRQLGLPPSGTQVEFVYVLTNEEYKGSPNDAGNSTALKPGVTAFLRPAGGAWTETAIGLNEKGNTYVTIP